MSCLEKLYGSELQEYLNMLHGVSQNDLKSLEAYEAFRYKWQVIRIQITEILYLIP